MHVFLTGEKQVGKTTRIEEILREKPMKTGGFRTVKATGIVPGETTLHLLDVLSDEAPDRENLLFICRKRMRSEAENALIRERFERLGCAALVHAREAGAERILMDELGPNEAEAAAFQAEIFRTLDGPVPVLGVLQKAESPFLDAIKNRPDVRVVEIRRER